MVYPDGTPVRGPKALCELQGYVYDAWVRMAEVFDALGKPDRARTLRDKAAALFEKFNEAFWDEETGFYAYMLDGEKRKVMTVASNPGHLLWSGIVPPDRAARVVARLMAPDMNSRLGHPHAVQQASGLQSVLVSERFGLAARQQPDRAWFQALRLQHGGGAHRARHQRAPPATSCSTSCRNFTPAWSATAPISRCSTLARTCRRPGRLAPASRCCRRCWASSRTHRTTSCMSIPTCRSGCRTLRCWICVSAAGIWISASAVTAKKQSWEVLRGDAEGRHLPQLG